jgi:hypothetical protein
MVRMVPADYAKNANFGEKKVFNALQGVGDRDDWIAFHSLKLAHNENTVQGENDFAVFMPGLGIVVIEVKNATSIDYKDGRWHLEGVPRPTKDPLEQANRSRGNIRSFLRKFDDIDDIPTARLLWFTAINRHALNNASPQDMTFHEWEMAWADDVAQPVALLERVMSNHMRDYGDAGDLSLDPAAFTVERARMLADKLVGSFTATQTPEDRQRDRRVLERERLDEQITYLDLVDTNEHIYFDGSAGTGKSFLLVEAALRLAKSGKRTLVTCWNYMMAEELGLRAVHPNIVVKDLNTVMLEITGQRNPRNAGSKWFREDLPKMALRYLDADKTLAEFDAICIDEFQDIAGTMELLGVALGLVKGGNKRESRIVLAGDKDQQIMSSGRKRIDPFANAKALIPDLVHVRLRTNCRNAAKLGRGIRAVTGLPTGGDAFRLGDDVDGGVKSIVASDAKQAKALRATLEELLKEFQPEDIRVLSAFGTRSLAHRVMHTESASADERWLKKNLRREGHPGRVRWRSISKYKGLEADVVVITDVNEATTAFARETGRTLNELLYVGMSRARYHVVLIGESAPILES